MEVRVRVDAAKATGEFRIARREIGRNLKAALVTGAERQVLPPIRSRAPSVVMPFLTVRATQRAAYLTTRGPRMGDRITGLLNYGGIVDSPIYAKTKYGRVRPMGTPFGPKSVVYRGHGGRGKPSVIEGKHFIEEGIDVGYPGLEDSLLEAVMDTFGDLADNEGI